jgi:hypothetical protein
MSALFGIVFFLVKFLLVFYFLARGVLLSGMFSILEPTDFGRRVKKSFLGIRGFIELDGTGKIELIPPIGPISVGICMFLVFAFLIDRNFGYLALAIGTIIPAQIRKNHTQEIIDERTFAQLSRILAAASEITLMFALAFFVIFRINMDVFAFLGCFFAVREIAYAYLAQKLEDAEKLESPEEVEVLEPSGE